MNYWGAMWNCSFLNACFFALTHFVVYTFYFTLSFMFPYLIYSAHFNKVNGSRVFDGFASLQRQQKLDDEMRRQIVEEKYDLFLFFTNFAPL